MKLYSQNENYKLYNGDMNDLNGVIESNSIDAIVTDPPYELGFMGKSWDASGIAFRPETWRHCWDVLKPGGYLLAFGGSRTFHRIACAIEDAGFEIRDTIIWLYGSGFPKSMNIGLAIDKKNGVESPVIGQNQDILKKQSKDLKEGHRIIANSFNAGAPDRNNGFVNVSADIRQAQNEWNGWGTALKPSFEPIIVARKPCEGSCVDNVLKYGVGGINIDECRIGTDYINGGTAPDLRDVGRKSKELIGVDKLSFGQVSNAKRIDYEGHYGRFPANLILTYNEEDKDEVCGGFPETKSTGGSGEASKVNTFANTYNGGWGKEKDCSHLGGLGDEGSASRYFYCAKASKRDRDEGLAGFEDKVKVFNGQSNKSSTDMKDVKERFTTTLKNTHPTVKPTALMSYLIRLVSPKGATILDPFMGSGSTGKAAMYENKDRNADYKFIGIELTDEYLPIAKARIDYVINNGVALDRGEDETVDEVSSEPKPKFERFTWDLE